MLSPELLLCFPLDDLFLLLITLPVLPEVSLPEIPEIPVSGLAFRLTTC